MDTTTELFFEILNSKRINYYKADVIHSNSIHIKDLGLRSLLHLSLDGFNLKNEEIINNLLSQKYIYNFSDDMLCSYVLMTLPQQDIYVLGPILSDKPTIHDIRKLFKRKNISESYAEEALQFYTHLPHLPDDGLWNGIINVFGGYFYPNNFTLKKESFTADTLEAVNFLKNAIPPTQNYDDIEYTYNMQFRFMEALSQGNLDLARNMLKKTSASHEIENRTDNELRDIRNMMIVLNTLCRLALQNAGIHPIQIDKLSREFSLRIESASTTKLQRNLSEEMIVRYCELVNTKFQTDNPKINRALNHIQTNFMHPITLSNTADLLHMSPNYLSKEFKKQTGQSFMDYLTNYRINSAKRMLEKTDYPISDIAEMCGFIDNNYFSRTFKKHVGTPPREYRKNNRL
ncbi:MAG: AraC family transcriptional regulator [Lachnospiraceae bacterium]|nr:AraC family transcriptional regulator [Lachnospiraceae bacterium]